jgi:glycosyltransferase involved in cell wall biosynthesis
MRVLLDARAAQRGLGIATFISRLREGMADKATVQIQTWGGKASSDRGSMANVLGHSGLFDLSPSLDPRSRGYDVVHYASGVGSVMPGRRSVLTLHDLMTRKRGRLRDRMIATLLERALPRVGRVIAVSNRSRHEAEHAFPMLKGHIDVIPHGMRSLARSTERREHLLAFGGAADPRKRVDLMIDVYRQYAAVVRDPLPLVVLARAGLTESQRVDLSLLGAEVVESASATEVDCLMRRAAALLFPSAAEGFGIPLLEAAEAGTPVVIDERASIPIEVVGTHCFRVRKPEVEAWVAELQRAVEAAPIYGGLQLPSWTEVAARYVEAYSEVSG